jgi:4-hydroxy-tetrahydrodipicolinate synthase
MATAMSQLTPTDAIAGKKSHIFGISAALVTPFGADGAISPSLAAEHAARVINNGAHGVTLFGTTGEGASLGLAERKIMLERIVSEAATQDQTTVCICATNQESALAQAHMALNLGVRKLLLTPPYYFKGVDDDALFDWFSAFIVGLGSKDPQIILYHIPQVTHVGISIALIRRLKNRFGTMIFGVKDSSGDWANSTSLLDFDDLAILIGDERLLAQAAPLGCAGAISGMANMIPVILSDILQSGVQNDAMSDLVTEIVRHPVTPVIKALVAQLHDQPEFARARPPLTSADPQVVSDLANRLKTNVISA